MPFVRNPILPGFNADPSIIRVGDDYYIATSTFEWFPGVQIYHSIDLANWELICRPLARKSQLDMRGDPDSCGVWAPCLSYDQGQFWLVYTDVKRKDPSFKDTLNYVITAPSIEGPWSDPTFINASGFDPSLFHDGDKKWYLNMICDHRSRPKAFAGTFLQEFDPVTRQLVGPRKNIYLGTSLGSTEGGTGYEHACSLARSRDIWGPYEDHPQKHVLTSKDTPRAAIQRAGHGDIVDTPNGRTYLVHLGVRPITQNRRCVLGRETYIQEAYWGEDAWLYIKNGPIPSLYVDVPGTFDEAGYWEAKKYTFKHGLPQDFQWLRTPEPERIFSVQGDHLTLYGRQSIGSWFEQALLARRQTHFSYNAETILDFMPRDERQFAGLTAYSSRFNFFYLTITAHSDGKRELLIQSATESYPDARLQPFPEPVSLPGNGKVKLAVSVRGDKLQFKYSLENENEKDKSQLRDIGPVYDASLLSDECGGHGAHGNFTGTFIGLACSDLNGAAAAATFDYFTYEPVKHETDPYE